MTFFVCTADDIRADTLGMAPCPRCFQLVHFPHGPLCDFTPDELDEVDEEVRDEAGRPDADHDEVLVMLNDPGNVVIFVDPFEQLEIYEVQSEILLYSD